MSNNHGLSPLAKAFIYAVIVADLLAVVYFGGTYILTGSILPTKHAEKTLVAGVEDGTAAKAPAAEAAPAFDPATYVASAEKGLSIAAKCKACHGFDKGGPNKTGPNLWAIVNAPLGHMGDYAYSEALLAKKAEWPTWTKEHLNDFLEHPKTTIAGTKMQFNGIRNPAERADLIAYLETLK